MTDERRRRHLGDSTSAAIPVLWAILASRDWTPAQFAAAAETDSGKMARLLYGDRKPGRSLSSRLRALGVADALWDAPLPAGWMLPHVTSDETGPQPIVTDADAALRTA